MPSDITTLEPKIIHSLNMWRNHSSNLDHWIITMFIFCIILALIWICTEAMSHSYILRSSHNQLEACIGTASAALGICLVVAIIVAIFNTVQDDPIESGQSSMTNAPSTALVLYRMNQCIASANSEHHKMDYDEHFIHKYSLHSADYTDASHDHYRQERMYKKNINYVRDHRNTVHKKIRFYN